MFDVVADVKPLVSPIWNSYIRTPVWSEVALRTVNVGRSVSSCSSLPGESRTGAVRVAATGVGVGELGDDLLHPVASNRHTAAEERGAIHSFTMKSSGTSFCGWSRPPVRAARGRFRGR